MQGEHIWGSAYRKGAITDDDEVSNILESLQELLQQTLPRIKAVLYRECESIGLTEPQTLESAKVLVDILEQVSQTFEVFQPDVFKTKFTDDIKSLAPASSWWFKKSYSSIFNKEYRRV